MVARVECQRSSGGATNRELACGKWGIPAGDGVTSMCSPLVAGRRPWCRYLTPAAWPSVGRGPGRTRSALNLHRQPSAAVSLAPVVTFDRCRTRRVTHRPGWAVRTTWDVAELPTEAPAPARVNPLLDHREGAPVLDRSTKSGGHTPRPDQAPVRTSPGLAVSDSGRGVGSWWSIPLRVGWAHHPAPPPGEAPVRHLAGWRSAFPEGAAWALGGQGFQDLQGVLPADLHLRGV
jgi:hypothetical protein